MENNFDENIEELNLNETKEDVSESDSYETDEYIDGDWFYEFQDDEDNDDYELVSHQKSEIFTTKNVLIATTVIAATALIGFYFGFCCGGDGGIENDVDLSEYERVWG